MPEKKVPIKKLPKLHPDMTFRELDVLAYLVAQVDKLETRVKLLETYIGKY